MFLEHHILINVTNKTVIRLLPALNIPHEVLVHFIDTFETLKYIIDLAHHLNMKVVAEGIENEQQLNLLESLDCDYAQGYY